jgi:tripartite-type tricarboxylate transporter receptor subunit TctC
MPISRRTLIATLGLSSVANLLPRSAFAAYPDRPIHLIVPFAPGGNADIFGRIVGRIVGEQMSQALGQPVVVDNRGGVGGSIGAEIVARATPDGYTIVIGQWDNHVGNGVVYTLNYDVKKDFEPIGLLSINPQLILARKTLPADDLKGLVAWMKANPG